MNIKNILEAKNVMLKPTDEWLEENYTKFNKEFFDNVLPQTIILKATKINNHWLGCQGFEDAYYYSRTSRTIYGYNNGKNSENGSYLVNNVEQLKPYIYLNNAMSFSLLEMENTLIHEMVHLYVYYLLNHKQPMQGHGKEFKNVAKQIDKKSKGKYKITTYADTHNGEYELDDNIKKQIEKRKQNRLTKNVISMIYFEVKKGQSKWFKEEKNFVITKKQTVDSILKEMERTFSHEKMDGYKIVVYNGVNDYVTDKFSFARTFRYYYYKDYADMCDKIQKNIKGENK